MCTFEGAGLWGVLTSFASLRSVHWQSVSHEVCVPWKVCKVTDIRLNRDINRKAGLVVCASFIWQNNKRDWEQKELFTSSSLTLARVQTDPYCWLKLELREVYPKLRLVACSPGPLFWELQVTQIWECLSYFTWHHSVRWWLRGDLMQESFWDPRQSGTVPVSLAYSVRKLFSLQW